MDTCRNENQIIENDNLLSFIIETYEDTKSLGSNIRLLRECLFEWHTNNKEIQNEYQISPRDVGPPLGVWHFSNPSTGH
jgi:hypothetical protein